MLEEILRLAVRTVAAYVRHNSVPRSEIEPLIRDVFATMAGLSPEGAADAPKRPPAVPASRSVMADHIVCLEDGKKLKMLKRYLREKHKLTPEQYRRRWGLPADYPMVAPNYAKQRSQFAKRSGLGRHRR
jgi:predicted transcriptional regulator